MPELSWSGAFILAGFRAFGFIALLPFGDGVHALVSRLVVALGLALILTPIEATAAVTPLAILGNLLFGLLLSLPIIILLEGIGMAGELIDVARGQTIAQVYDPLQHVVTSPLAVAGRQLAWITLLLVRGEESLLPPLHNTLHDIPLAQPLELFTYIVGWNLLEGCAALLASSLQVVLPVLMSFFFIEFIFGITAKVAGRTSLEAASGVAKLVAGGVLLLALWRGGAIPELFPAPRFPSG